MRYNKKKLWLSLSLKFCLNFFILENKIFVPPSIPSSLLLSLSLTVRQVCVCLLSPAVTPPPPVSSSLHLHLSCSSGILLWADRKLRRRVIRPPAPAPPTVFSVNQRQYFPFPNIHFHPHASYICCSPRFGVSLLQICI